MRNQFTFFLSELDRLLYPLNMYVIDANLWFDGGKRYCTTYHNDVWHKAPLDNKVIQLWIPLMAQGTPEAVAASMIRLDPQPLEDDWACGSGTSEYTHIHTGETRPFEFSHYHGIITEDLEGAVGGNELAVGDVLYFDNSYCYYSLPSTAKGVAFAIRVSCGVPIYNGYFDSPKPLDQRTFGEPQRLAWKQAIGNTPAGQDVLPAVLRKPPGGLLQKLAGFFLLVDAQSNLNPILAVYAGMIAAEFGAAMAAD